MIFFGCIGQPGHHYWDNEVTRTHRSSEWRWFDKFDGVLTHRNGVGERFNLHHLYDGAYTVLAFADHTVDTRPNSNGAFILMGDISRTEMIDAALLAFPNVCVRVGLEAAQ